MSIVFTGVRRFGAFLAENTKLFFETISMGRILEPDCGSKGFTFVQYCLPLVITLLDGICHIFGARAAE